MSVTYDSKSYLIDDQRIFLKAAAVHYFRMPQAEWRDVLMKAKLAGMNCIDTYFAWNVHEPMEGNWDFNGDNDCGAFLDLCAELGLWVIARPGPYICAEWDFGGFPWWLAGKPGMKYRDHNDVFMKYVETYFDRIVPIIAARQHGLGGSVILVQVENEYAHLASDEEGKLYLDALRDGLLARGITVPLICCMGGVEGAVEGANFWSGADDWFKALQEKQPDTPKIVTEFWTGWFEHWGAAAALQKTPALLEKRIMEVLRAGYSGISQYMFYGGTNFGDYGGRTVGASDIYMVTSYDYNATLDEYGGLTEKFSVTKRMHSMIDAMSDFWLNSEEVPANVRAGDGCSVRARKSGDSIVYFIESLREERETFYFTDSAGRTFHTMANPGQIVPISVHIPVIEGVTIDANGWIGYNDLLGDVPTLLLFTGNGQRISLTIASTNNIIEGAAELPVRHHLSVDKRSVTLDFYAFSDPQTAHLTIGGHTLRIVVLNEEMMNRTWKTELLLPDGNIQDRLVIGCDELSSASDGELLIKSDPLSLICAIDQDVTLWLQETGNGNKSQNTKLHDWSKQEAGFVSSAAASPTGPSGFSNADHPFGHLLFSTDIHSEDDVESSIVMPHLADPARVFVNGMEQGFVYDTGAAIVRVALSQGVNRIEWLVQNMGRYNFSYDLGEEKGLFGHAYLGGDSVSLLRGWSAYGTNTNIHLDEVASPEADADRSSYLTKSITIDGKYDRAVLVGAVAKQMKVNGVQVDMAGYNNWYKFRTVDLSALITPGENTIEIERLQTPIARLELLLFSSGEQIKGISSAPLLRPGDTKQIIPEGTLTAAVSFTNRTADKQSGKWLPIEPDGKVMTGRPTWFRCNISLDPNDRSALTGLKIRMSGMGKGSLWLNGLHLGRYWHIGPQEDYKIPLSWIRPTNELLIFDEEGRVPNGVRLIACSGSIWESLNAPKGN